MVYDALECVLCEHRVLYVCVLLVMPHAPALLGHMESEWLACSVRVGDLRCVGRPGHITHLNLVGALQLFFNSAFAGEAD